MRSRAAVAGLAALAFSVLTIIGLLVASPPGGSYSAHDATKYVAKGHHAAVFVAAYLLLLGTFALIWLLAYLRDVVFVGTTWPSAGRVFWGAGLCAVASLATGWMVILGVSIAHAYGGKGVVTSPTVTYLVVEAGSTAVWGAAAVMLGLALVILLLASASVFPLWLRVATGIAGVGGLAGFAFFPTGLLILWGIVIGVWLLLAGRRLDAPPSNRTQAGVTT
jgi:hypothetical protein